MKSNGTETYRSTKLKFSRDKCTVPKADPENHSNTTEGKMFRSGIQENEFVFKLAISSMSVYL